MNKNELESIKRIEIKLIDPNLFSNDECKIFGLPHCIPRIKESECYHILENTRTDVSLEDALNVLIREMFSRNTNEIIIDINGRNNSYKHTMEMTLEEIEAELGHKIKIVREKEETND